jgi:hypothetical protein
MVLSHIKPLFLDDLSITLNRNFKHHLIKLEIVLAKLSIAGVSVNNSKTKFFTEKNTWKIDAGSSDKVFNLNITSLSWMISSTLRFPKQEKHIKLRQCIGIVNYYRNIWFYKCELLWRFHWIDSKQERSSLNGTHPINSPVIKLRKSL